MWNISFLTFSFTNKKIMQFNNMRTLSIGHVIQIFIQISVYIIVWRVRDKSKFLYERFCNELIEIKKIRWLFIISFTEFGFSQNRINVRKNHWFNIHLYLINNINLCGFIDCQSFYEYNSFINIMIVAPEVPIQRTRIANQLLEKSWYVELVSSNFGSKLNKT